MGFLLSSSFGGDVHLLLLCFWIFLLDPILLFIPFFCSTPPEAFFRPDRSLAEPTRAAAVNDGPTWGRRKACH
jgi:hypothetical protein